MSATTPPSAPAPTGDASADECAVVELRTYTLHPGQRDILIALFDREFVESQEAQGMRVLGQFRDGARPDRFVWLRGFADMQARHAALQAFYGGPVWAAHRDAANATMVDSDNVRLLRPAWPGATTGLAQRPRPAAGTAAAQQAGVGVVDATVFPLRAPSSAELLAFCRERMAPALQRGGARQLAWYCTESAPNTFTRLPVREGEQVLVGLAVFDDAADLQAFADSGAWTEQVAGELAQWLAGPAQAHRLQPTGRSALRL